MSKRLARLLGVLLALTLVVAACGGNDDDSDDGTTEDTSGETDDSNGDGDEATEEIDYEEIGLWDDGPCDESLEPLHVGLITTFESPVVSLIDQALALEASVEAFNGRGGANGACVEVTTCDDGTNLDQALGCVREFEEAGVDVTVNDQSTAAQGEVSTAMADAGIPRVASNVTNNDWGDQNAYPMDASGTGVTFLLPQALIAADVTEIGIIRVDTAGAGALTGLLESLYEGDASFPVDVPVPGGTTDFTQFIQAAEGEGAGGIVLALGEQEAIQVVRAGEQLGTEMLVGSSLGTFSHASVSDLGDFAGQMRFLWSFPPATSTEIPAYDALRADLAASGEESLQLENLKASPMRSWLGLYALLHMIRDADLTEFSGETITTMLQEAEDVPMLGIFGGEEWTPDMNHEGLFQRAGTNHWATYSWDPDAEAPGGLEGNWVETSTFSFDEVLCGSPFGPPEPCS
ncbi:MAG: ABC transporter substrate-binding protein [Acidimicrobiales bacterium]|nr:ABC transporter substrate-binding protein [Acidimicrobiales bacterium]